MNPGAVAAPSFEFLKSDSSGETAVATHEFSDYEEIELSQECYSELLSDINELPLEKKRKKSKKAFTLRRSSLNSKDSGFHSQESNDSKFKDKDRRRKKSEMRRYRHSMDTSKGVSNGSFEFNFYSGQFKGSKENGTKKLFKDEMKLNRTVSSEKSVSSQVLDLSHELMNQRGDSQIHDKSCNVEKNMVELTKSRAKKERRSSTPLQSSWNELSVEEKGSFCRRSKSADRAILDPDEPPPLIIFPINVNKLQESNTDDPRPREVIRNNLLNKGIVPGNDNLSLCGSFAPSLAGSTGFASTEIERLRQTIMRRGSSTSSRRPSFSSIGTSSTRGSSVVIAQLELLQKRVAEHLDEDIASLASSIKGLSLRHSLAIGGSVRSINSEEATLMEAFFDPSAEAPPYLTIYYATQSGTSEFYAYVLQQEGQTMGLDVAICNVGTLMHSIEMSLDQELSDILVPHKSQSGRKRGRALFLISTSYDGGPSDDAVTFLKSLQGIKDHKYLKGLRYAVFGFGSSNFSATYNLQGKLYDQLLSQIGAKRIVPLGLGDDAKDIDWDVEEWKWKSWWPTIADLASRDNNVSHVLDDTSKSTRRQKRNLLNDDIDARYSIEYLSQQAFDEKKANYDHISLHNTSKHFREGCLLTVSNVMPLWRDPDLISTQRPVGSTVHISLAASTLTESSITIKTGDNLAILPENESSLVEAVARQLKYDLDALFVVKPYRNDEKGDLEILFPTPCSVREYLTKYAELATPPRRAVIRALSRCAKDSEERDELYQLSSKKHRDKFKTQVISEHIGFGEFVSSYYKSLEIPLSKFISLCTPMQPRWYSLSGSTLMNKAELHLTISVISIQRKIDDSLANGVASNYLANMPVGGQIRIIRSSPSGFVVPMNTGIPLIMIANGAGIAPMLALIQERHYQKTVEALKVGPTELFFGIRRRDLDFLYRDEIRRYKLAGSLTSLQLACSREQMHKIYVQHLVAKNADHIWRMLQRGAHIYVCGGTQMSLEVDQVLRAIISKNQERSTVSTDDFISLLKREGRYIREAFDSSHI
jgi:NADPH-ferrihemoprotein reductase